MKGRILGAVLFGLLGVVMLPAAPASAHAALVRTAPVQGTIVAQAPNEIVITFSEHISAVKGKVRVVGPDGKSIDNGEPRIFGDDLRIPVRTDVARGTYLVSYRVISADSHPVGAGYTYSFGAPSASVAQSSAGTSSDTSGRIDPPVAIAVSASNYLGFAGLILVAGPALVLLALWPPRLSRRGPTRLAYLGVGLIGVATVMQLYLQAPYENGGSLFSGSPGDLSGILASQFGTMHLIRLGAVIIGAVLLRPYLAGRTDPDADGRITLSGLTVRASLGILAGAAVATWPLSGHPTASTAPILTVIADVAHLSSMAIWLGGLVMLVGFLLRQANARELGAILPVWSNWAALAVAVLVLAGTAQALIEIVTLNALLHTTYGLLVLLKVGLLIVVLGGAAISRRLVQRRALTPSDNPANEPDKTGVRRLRLSVLFEIAGAVLVLALASALVQTTPARNAAAATTQQGSQDIFATTLDCKLYQLQLDVEPIKLGNNEVHLYAYAPDGKPIGVKEWKGSAALPAQGIEPIDISMLPLTDSHTTGTVTLPARGDWRFSFTLRTSEIDEATVTTTITIR